MTRRDRAIEYLSRGYSMSWISETLRISRQRVYQIGESAQVLPEWRRTRQIEKDEQRARERQRAADRKAGRLLCARCRKETDWSFRFLKEVFCSKECRAAYVKHYVRIVSYRGPELRLEEAALEVRETLGKEMGRK